MKRMSSERDTYGQAGVAALALAARLALRALQHKRLGH